MLHREFNKTYIWQPYKEPWMDTIECVGLPKLYCRKLWFPIGAFGWSAINGWETGCPFDDKWKRVEYKPWLYPPQWAILFWSEKRCKYGHTWVSNKFCNANVLRYIDSNGTGHRDVITARFTDYKNFLGWFERIR